MPLVPIKLHPGINSVQTPTLNEAGFVSGQNIRFFEGLPQKDGGFIRFSSVPLGIPRALKAWTALSGISYLAVGTTDGLYVILSGQAHDISPIPAIGSPLAGGLMAIAIDATAGSNLFVIHDTVNLPAVNSYLQIRDPISVAGVILVGVYQVQSVVAGVSYTIKAAQTATSTVMRSGMGRRVQSGPGQRVTVALPNHGLSVGSVDTYNNPFTVDVILLSGSFPVVEVDDQDVYQIDVGPQFAQNSVTAFENQGLMAIAFFGTTVGWSGVNAPQAHLDNFGEFLIACPWGGPLFVWQPSKGATTLATIISTAPQQNSIMFISSQQQMVVVFGTIDRLAGNYDAMLVRWSDVSDYTNWIPTATDQAGSFRLSIGSERRAAIALPGQNLLWTDLALYSMQYVNFPLVWGFQPLGVNCGADGPHAVGILNGIVYWKNRNQFMVLTGAGPETLPCPVWDDVFVNQDVANLANVVCETNAFFGEVGWTIPQKNGTFVFARLKVSTSEPPQWTVSAYHHHTAWIDQNPFGFPLGGHEDGIIDAHDAGIDAFGAALPTSLVTGRIKIAEGDQITFIRGLYPDIKWLSPGTLNLTASFFDDPNKPPRVTKTYPIVPTTQFVPLRGRGRDVQFSISGNDIGSNWRLGLWRYYGAADGKR